MNLIQADLDRIAHFWNPRTIRVQKNVDIPEGKSDVLYLIPEVIWNTGRQA